VDGASTVILAPAPQLQLRRWTVPPMSMLLSGCRRKGTYGSSSQEFSAHNRAPLRELGRHRSTSPAPGASQEGRAGLDLGYNIRAKNLDIARTHRHPYLSKIPGHQYREMSVWCQGISRAKKFFTDFCSIWRAETECCSLM
jgi:hypothetical protein